MKHIVIFVLALLIVVSAALLADYGIAAQDDARQQATPQRPADIPEYVESREQPQWCGTNELWELRMAQLGIAEPMACSILGPCDVTATRDATPTDPILVRVLFHAMHRDDGSGGVSQASVDATLVQMQSDYAPFNIRFESTGTRHHNDTANYCIGAYGSTSWWLDIDAMKNAYAESPGTQCNVFISCQDTGTSGYLLGVATFPWDPDALTKLGGLWLNNVAVGAGAKTLTHEMGHCLGLWHTHHGVSEVTSCGSCYEYASGFEGDVRGDFASDTPPTPTNYTCSPPGGSDCQGTPWGATQPENYMGYGPDWCYSLFTNHQALRMHCWIDGTLSGWLGSVCDATAIFDSDVTHGCAPLTVNFNDLSTGPVVSWKWKFGDGDSSLVQNPSHVYTAPGNYTVELTVSSDTCSHAETKADYITIPTGAVCLIEPSSLDFGEVELGASLDLSFTITNYGCDTLSGSTSEICVPYSLDTGGGPYTIPPLDSLVVTVRYSPTSIGTQNCWIETGDALCADVLCAGVGVQPPPNCVTDPDTLIFGDVAVGGFKILTFDITNNGYGVLSGTVTETCDYFAINGIDTYSLTHGQSHTMSIIYFPGVPGTHDCFLDLGSIYCGDYLCTGAGTGPAACLVDPDTLDFGTVLVGDSLDQNFIITNTGGGNLTGSVSDTCSYYNVVSGGGPYDLGNGDTLVVKVRFKPQADGQLACFIETGTGGCPDVYCQGTGDPGASAIYTVTPGKLMLYQNYPNPFNPSTTIAFSLPEKGRVSLVIYDVNGGLVKTIVSEVLDQGLKEYHWDGTASNGSTVSSGIYFYRLKTAAKVLTRKMVLLK